MGQAEVIAFDEVRARQRQDTLRQKLHACFERWLARLEERLPAARGTLLETPQAVWDLRQSLTGSLTAPLLQHTHEAEYNRHHAACPQCERSVKTRGPGSRTLETLVGPVQLQRPYFYCTRCRLGFSPLDTALGVLGGHIQLDVQQAAAKVAAEVPYEIAHTLFTDLTGVP